MSLRYLRALSHHSCHVIESLPVAAVCKGCAMIECPGASVCKWCVACAWPMITSLVRMSYIIYIYMYTNQSLTICLDSVVYDFKAQHLPHKSLPSTLTKLTSLIHNADQDRNVSHRSTRISRTSDSKNRSRTYGYECVLRRARLGRRSFRRAR